MSEDHRLIWSSNGECQFGYGVSKGVLYVKKSVLVPESITDYEYGVAWNGLTSVKLGRNDPFGYLNADNLKWNRNSGNEYLTGTIEAVNYPEEFMACDGKRNASSGVYVGQQTGKAFGMCYRTELGDEHDQEAGYLIHIIYDIAVGPTDVVYTTIGDTIEIDSYSWDFETLPVEVDGYKPFSEIVIDSRNVPVDKLETIERVLYGYGDSMPYLPKPHDLLEMMKDPETVDWISELFNKTIPWYYGPEATVIPSHAFGYCYSLSRVSFPLCISIGYGAFEYCSSLTRVDFPMCRYIGGHAFIACQLVSVADFPACISIGVSAFDYCHSLTSINFPVCTHIDDRAFAECFFLSNTNFPACTSIGREVFHNCYSLTSVSFSLCGYIGALAFEYCKSLISVDFPVCSIISYSAFYRCSHLTTVALRYSSVVSIYGPDVFASTPMLYSNYLGYYGSIYVPASLVSAYKSARYWSYYSDRITSIPE